MWTGFIEIDSAPDLSYRQSWQQIRATPIRNQCTSRPNDGVSFFAINPARELVRCHPDSLCLVTHFPTVDEFAEAIANAAPMPESSNDTIFVGSTV